MLPYYHGVYIYGNLDVPLLELRVDNPVRESFPADTDSLKHTITLQLIQYKSSVNHTYTIKYLCI